MNRVVVTGLGAITPLGHTVSEYWDKLKKGASGLGPVTLVEQSPDLQPLTQKVVAEVKNFDPLKYFEERDLTTLDRVSQFSVAAAKEAIVALAAEREFGRLAEPLL